MDQEQQLLKALLSGLESIRMVTDTQIMLIKQAIAPPPPEPLPPGALGIDTLGRVIRPRNISPELRERKRKLIAEARKKQADKRALEQAAYQKQQEAQRTR